MEVYRTEAEQIQALKQWWNENGKAIIAGVVIGFAALFGWRGWQANLTTESLAASDIYQQMIGSARADQPETAQTHANTLLAEYKSTAYAHYAALLLAKYAAENTDYASAGEQLRRVMDTASQEQIRHIARLRLARVLLADNKFTDAQALLDGTDQGQFTPSIKNCRVIFISARAIETRPEEHTLGFRAVPPGRNKPIRYWI